MFDPQLSRQSLGVMIFSGGEWARPDGRNKIAMSWRASEAARVPVGRALTYELLEPEGQEYLEKLSKNVTCLLAR